MRFQQSVPVSLVAQRLQPSSVVPDLSEWRPDHEIADRLEIEREVSKYVDSMQTISRSGNADEAYDILLQLFPNFFEKFFNRRGLNVERFYQTISTLDNSPRKNRKTIPFIGSLFTKLNSKTLGKVIDYGVGQVPWEILPKKLSYGWMAPQISTWGASSIARSTNDLIRKKITRANGDAASDLNVSNICVFPGKHPFYLRDVFDFVEDFENTHLPRELEVLYVPGILTAVSVHAPIAQNFGFPTALGAISFDELSIDRTHDLLAKEFENADSDRLNQFLRDAKVIASHQFIDQSK